MSEKKLTYREISTVLAALRYWQENVDEEYACTMDHFADVDPITGDDEIDALCEKINCEIGVEDEPQSEEGGS